MTEKTLRIIIVIFGLTICNFIVFLGNQKIKLKEQKILIDSLSTKINNLKKSNDSLYSELFPSEVELSRYELAYRIFMKRNPVAARQYGTIISEETE